MCGGFNLFTRFSGSLDPTICLISLPLAAILTVDHSVVDLETIEALYENVGGAIALDQRSSRAHVSHFLYDLSAEGATRGTGEDQEPLRDVRGRGSEAAGQT